MDRDDDLTDARSLRPGTCRLRPAACYLRPLLAPAGVGSSAVIGLLATGHDLAALGFCHVKPQREGLGTLHLESLDVRLSLSVRAPDQLTPDAPHLTPFRLESADWSSGPIVLLTRGRDRRVGLRPLPGPFGALLRTGSIHTFGMQAPIGVVALDSEGIVTRAAVVQPHRVFVAKRARWILEIGPIPLPKVGISLEVILDS